MELTKSMIKLIQKELKKKGLYNDDIDGIMGNHTKQGLDSISRLNREWNYKRKAIGFIQVLCIENNIETGSVDGIWGPQTAYAYDVLKEYLETGIMPSKWRDITPLNVNPHNWPEENERDLIDFYGNPGENLVPADLPYPHRLAWDKRRIVNRIYCNKKVKDSLITVLSRVIANYSISEIRELGLDLYGGCYNKRKKRGGSTWSTHAWGIAIDYNPDYNQLTWGRDRAVFARPEYDKWWRFWEEEGWSSLGRIKNYDWMHVQAAKIN